MRKRRRRRRWGGEVGREVGEEGEVGVGLDFARSPHSGRSRKSSRVCSVERLGPGVGVRASGDDLWGLAGQLTVTELRPSPLHPTNPTLINTNTTLQLPPLQSAPPTSLSSHPPASHASTSLLPRHTRTGFISSPLPPTLPSSSHPSLLHLHPSLHHHLHSAQSRPHPCHHVHDVHAPSL